MNTFISSSQLSVSPSCPSLGIFESKEQAALAYARHIGSEEAAALAVTYKEKEEAAARKEKKKKGKKPRKKPHAGESAKKRPQEERTSPRHIRNRLAKIVEGTAGFADTARKSFRDLGGAMIVIEGTKYTCIQDSIITTARWLGVKETKKRVYDDLVDPLHPAEISISDAVNYVRDVLELKIECLTHNTVLTLSIG